MIVTVSNVAYLAAVLVDWDRDLARFRKLLTTGPLTRRLDRLAERLNRR